VDDRLARPLREFAAVLTQRSSLADPSSPFRTAPTSTTRSPAVSSPSTTDPRRLSLRSTMPEVPPSSILLKPSIRLPSSSPLPVSPPPLAPLVSPRSRRTTRSLKLPSTFQSRRTLLPFRSLVTSTARAGPMTSPSWTALRLLPRRFKPDRTPETSSTETRRAIRRCVHLSLLPLLSSAY
jgi:hypothetical protein